ncbi:MAG: hypothetical protein ACHQ0J_13505 [Candidatus Dormibacterales bacterium]
MGSATAVKSAKSDVIGSTVTFQGRKGTVLSLGAVGARFRVKLSNGDVRLVEPQDLGKAAMTMAAARGWKAGHRYQPETHSWVKAGSTSRKSAKPVAKKAAAKKVASKTVAKGEKHAGSDGRTPASVSKEAAQVA